MTRIYRRPPLPHQPAAPLPSAASGHETRRDGPAEDDRALSDGEIRRLLGISKPTMHRYREKYGLPGPSFRLGQRSFTWRSAILGWIAERKAQPVTYTPHMNRRRPEAAE